LLWSRGGTAQTRPRLVINPSQEGFNSESRAVSQTAISTDNAIDQINAGIWSDAKSATQTQFISFAIGDDQYGVDIMSVREIKGWTDITHLPKQPDYVRGVLNLRGAIVPIVDLRCRFGQGLTETTPLHIVIIVQVDGRQIGLIGDRVLDIVSVEASDIQAVPRTTQNGTTDFLSGLVTLDNGMIALIDLTHLLSTENVGELVGD
jgi:purine-binding chemotaxis protein CheW